MSISGFTIPVTIDGLTLLAVLLGIIALAGIGSGVVNLVRKERVRRRRFGGGVVMLLLALVLFGFAGWAQTYRTLTRNELVALVRAIPVQNMSQTMSVTYIPLQDGRMGPAHTYVIKGDEWMLAGDVIKWQDWMNILGVHTGYRITRLQGYYRDANDANTKKMTAIDLNGGTDNVYMFLQQHNNLVPFVRAVYGNAVFSRPDAMVTYKVYVSTSGYWTATQ